LKPINALPSCKIIGRLINVGLSANTENLINHLNQYGLGMDPRVVDDIIAKKIKYKELDGRLPFYVVDHLIISQME